MVRYVFVVLVPDARYVGRVPFLLSPVYGLFLGLECFQDATPLLLDNKVFDGGPFWPPFWRGSMKTFVIVGLRAKYDATPPSTP